MIYPKDDVVAVLAREILGSSVGAEVSEGRFGREETAAAQKFLADRGAAVLEKGVLVGRDIPRLWQLSGFGTVLALMPLPFSLRFEGLAAGLQQAFAKVEIPFRLGFMRGATRRVDSLIDGRCDMIVASKMTARLDLEMERPISLMHVFGLETFVQEYVVAFRDPKARSIQRGMRVALDPVSIDQTILTSYECEGVEVEFVDAPYARSLQKLQENQVDAVIWSRDELEERNMGFNIQPLSDTSPRRVAGEDTVAVLATSRDKAELGAILQVLIDFNDVQNVQQQVLHKRMHPFY